jgi:dihydroxyacetone kinase
MMTALDMRGFSLSVYPASAADLAALNSSVQVMAWPGLAKFGPPQIVPMPAGITPKAHAPSANAQGRKLVLDICATLLAAAPDLNALDAKSGDGDTGSTLAGAARALRDRVDELPLNDIPALYRSVSQVLSQTMGGSSGVLLAIFFSAAGEAAASGAQLPEALRAGLQRMQQIGGAQLGDRTMVDSLAPALDDLTLGLPAAAAAAREGANLTATMTQARSGRASYVIGGQLAGHIDPGAEAVARLFESVVQ